MADKKLQHPQESATTELSPAQLRDVQNKLDELQQGGMTPEKLRLVLFHKMLDFYQVPRSHFLRKGEVPARLDDPGLVERLQELGFSRISGCSYH